MSDWTTQRARFNHDKLKNQFLLSVGRLVRALEGHTLDQEFVDAFLRQLPSAWAELESEAGELLGRAESEAGPPAWFHTYLLHRLSGEDRLWMRELLTHEWRTHGTMSAAVDRAGEALKEAREQCRQLEEAFQASHRAKGRDAKQHREEDGSGQELLYRTVALHQACQRLSEAFQSLVPDDPIRALAKLGQRRCV